MGSVAARIPANESDRLAALRRYRVLDTPREQRFDRLTALAARLLDVPIALVTLIDADRQWIKSSTGIDATETSRRDAFCAHAILDDRPTIVSDAHEDARFRGNPFVTGDPNVRFYAGAPLTTPSGHRIGALCAIDKRPRDISPAALETLVELAAMVVDELELRRALDRAERAEAALEVSKHELADRVRVLEGILDAAGEGIAVVDASSRLVVFNPSAERMIGRAGADATMDERSRAFGFFAVDRTTPFDPKELPLARALRGETSDETEIFAKNALHPEGRLLSINARPLRAADDRIVGGVATFRDVTALRAAEERLRATSVTDALTGVPNRRAFDERLSLLCAEGARGRRFALVMLDIDHFKRVNDTHGHPVGDTVLVTVAGVLRASVRKTDLVARYGGEELAVLYTDVDVAMAATLAEKLRVAVEALPGPPRVTASFGVAAWSKEAGSPEALKAAADAALYRAKDGGRNRVVSHAPG